MRVSVRVFELEDFDLDATMRSGQAFRWRQDGIQWTGVVGSRWVRLSREAGATVLRAESFPQCEDWGWLRHYLQFDCSLRDVIDRFPKDPVLLQAVNRWRGLRLLRQDPWECLATFILSSTKQIVQIQQIVAALCDRFGTPILTDPNGIVFRAFPTPTQVAEASEASLRECKMGFRAAHLLACARRVSNGSLDLESLRRRPLEEARAALMDLPGVGPKIADCVLLFALGFQEAFPIDVWVARVLKDHYFAGHPVTLPALRIFAREHFGPQAGYAQQYLFHHIRMLSKRS